MSAQIINFRPSGNQDWVQSAACADPDAPSMFPADTDRVGIELARDICNGCPVRQTCLDDALRRGEAFGVWGGLSADERRSLRRQKKRAPAKGNK